MILVTGTSGFVGQVVTRHLDAAGLAWRAYQGRINNPLQLRPQLKAVETVIHLAGAEVRGRQRLLQHVDVEGTERLLEECGRAGVRHLLLLSRLGADPNSLHGLLRAKGEAERLVRKSGVPYTILRSATLYGQGDRFTEMILALALWSWPIVWLPGGGRVVMQPLWVEDLARCLVRTVRRPDLLNQTVVVSGDERLSYRDVVREVLAAAQLRRLPLQIPLALLHPVTSLLFSWWYWPPVTRFFVDRFFVPEVADLDDVLRLYRFRPARLSETITYVRRPRMRLRLFLR